MKYSREKNAFFPLCPYSVAMTAIYGMGFSCCRKRQTSPEPAVRREVVVKAEASINGRWNGTSHAPQRVFNDTPSPKSTDYEETDGEQKSETLDRTYVYKAALYNA